MPPRHPSFHRHPGIRLVEPEPGQEPEPEKKKKLITLSRVVTFVVLVGMAALAEVENGAVTNWKGILSDWPSATRSMEPLKEIQELDDFSRAQQLLLTLINEQSAKSAPREVAAFLDQMAERGEQCVKDAKAIRTNGVRFNPDVLMEQVVAVETTLQQLDLKDLDKAKAEMVRQAAGRVKETLSACARGIERLGDPDITGARSNNAMMNIFLEPQGQE